MTPELMEDARDEAVGPDSPVGKYLAHLGTPTL